jgi:hypothetical protein
MHAIIASALISAHRQERISAQAQDLHRAEAGRVRRPGHSTRSSRRRGGARRAMFGWLAPGRVERSC